MLYRGDGDAIVGVVADLLSKYQATPEYGRVFELFIQKEDAERLQKGQLLMKVELLDANKNV